MTSLLKQASFPINTTIGDVLNPAFTGKFTLLDGRDTAYPHEALASPGFLQRFNLQLGEKLATNAGEFTIVGVIRNHQVDDMDSGGFYVQAADLPDALVPDSSETVYYLAGDTPADWPFAQRLNHLGAVLTSPELMRNPPSAEETGASASEFADMPEDNGTMLIASGALAAALVLLEVVLLAGAAFAVGTRKQQRDLALLAVSGAESPTLKAVVTSGGLWLGTLGGLAGALVGTGVASWWILHKIGRATPRFGSTFLGPDPGPRCCGSAGRRHRSVGPGSCGRPTSASRLARFQKDRRSSHSQESAPWIWIPWRCS